MAAATKAQVGEGQRLVLLAWRQEAVGLVLVRLLEDVGQAVAEGGAGCHDVALRQAHQVGSGGARVSHVQTTDMTGKVVQAKC